MVEVLDANGNTIAGYEASKCLIEDQDGSNIALLWNGSNTTSLAGQIVQLKFYFMDANIYSVGE